MPPIEREKPWVRAHAIWSAKEVIDEPFAALNADDFLSVAMLLSKAHDFLANEARTKSSACRLPSGFYPIGKRHCFTRDL